MDSKVIFIARESRQVEIYNAVLKACEILMAVAKEWKQKVVNIRFADAVNKALEDAGLSEIKFTLGRGETYQRFKFYLAGNIRWVASVNAYVKVSDFYLTRQHDNDYLTDTNRLNQEALQQAVDEEIQYLTKCVANLTDAIENYDLHTAQVQQLIKQFKDGMEKIPFALRPMYSINNY